MKVLTIGFALLAWSTFANADEIGEAQSAALKWLADLDAERYEQTWEKAASIFKSKISQKRWARAASRVRSPLGGLESRELIAAKRADSLPGAPDGKYVVLQFRTKFKNKGSAVETITPVLEGDHWRVSGYFIK